MATKRGMWGVFFRGGDCNLDAQYHFHRLPDSLATFPWEPPTPPTPLPSKQRIVGPSQTAPGIERVDRGRAGRQAVKTRVKPG